MLIIILIIIIIIIISLQRDAGGRRVGLHLKPPGSRRRLAAGDAVQGAPPAAETLAGHAVQGAARRQQEVAVRPLVLEAVPPAPLAELRPAQEVRKVRLPLVRGVPLVARPGGVPEPE